MIRGINSFESREAYLEAYFRSIAVDDLSSLEASEQLLSRVRDAAGLGETDPSPSDIEHPASPSVADVTAIAEDVALISVNMRALMSERFGFRGEEQ